MAATALSLLSTGSATVLGVLSCRGFFPAKLGQEQPLHRRASLSTAHSSLTWRLQMKWPFFFNVPWERQEGLCRQQGRYVHCVLQGLGPQKCVPAAFKYQHPRKPVAPALPSWCLLVSSLVAETPHRPLAPLISLKPRRESAPWGGGARRGMSQLSAGRDCGKRSEVTGGKPVLEEALSCREPLQPNFPSRPLGLPSTSQFFPLVGPFCWQGIKER